MNTWKPRSCVDQWIIDYVCKVHEAKSGESFNVLFDIYPQLGFITLADAIMGKVSSWKQIRPRIWAALNNSYMISTDELRQILSM